MVKELREFLLRGNVVDLAVAVVIGAAFAAVVNSFVADIVTPLLGLLGIPDFSTWTITIGDAEMRPGLFLNALISFVVVAAAIFLVVVKPMNAAMKRSRKDEEAAPAGPTEVELLTQIRDELAKRA
jgi:large conductance mechanosensitive channel